MGQLFVFGEEAETELYCPKMAIIQFWLFLFGGLLVLAVFSGAFAGVVLALAAASVGLVVYSVRRRWLLAELLVVRKERGVAQ